MSAETVVNSEYHQVWLKNKNGIQKPRVDSVANVPASQAWGCKSDPWSYPMHQTQHWQLWDLCLAFLLSVISNVINFPESWVYMSTARKEYDLQQTELRKRDAWQSTKIKCVNTTTWCATPVKPDSQTCRYHTWAWRQSPWPLQQHKHRGGRE